MSCLLSRAQIVSLVLEFVSRRDGVWFSSNVWLLLSFLEERVNGFPWVSPPNVLQLIVPHPCT